MASGKSGIRPISTSDSTSSLLEEVTQICSQLSTTGISYAHRNAAKDLSALLQNNPHIEAIAGAYDNIIEVTTPSTKPIITTPKSSSSSSHHHLVNLDSKSPFRPESSSTPSSASGGKQHPSSGLNQRVVTPPKVSPRVTQMITNGTSSGVNKYSNRASSNSTATTDTETSGSSASSRHNNNNLRRNQQSFEMDIIRRSQAEDLDDDDHHVSSGNYRENLIDYEHQAPSNALRVIGMRKKDDEPLGMTVKVENERVVIARILANGLVDRQGLLHVGDTIVEVNNIPIRSPEDLMDEVRKSRGSVNFKVIPSFQSNQPQMASYMRALYTYDPSQDSLIPCKELGIPFVTGEVLEVLNQEDPNWWQARKLTEPNLPAGLIPSQELEERRRAFVLPEFDYATKTSICGTKVTKKKKKEFYQLNQYTDFEKAELILYEEVCRMPPFERRTLVLIGAQGVGRRTLKSRLINYDPDRFAGPLPHTSRPIRENEVDGKQYHFVRREIMEQDISDNKYLECGELQGHLYGTKLESISSIIRSGKMCVIDCNPQCLKLLKTKEFMPFVVFIAAPPIEQLRYMHEWGRNHGFGTTGRTYTFDRALGRNSRRGRTIQSLASFYEDEDLQNTIEESARLYRMHETQFDLVIVNNNFDKTFEQLRESLDALSTEPQWVPITWVYND